MLPNFLIPAPPKCGTTSLRNYLAQHPEVYAYPKEIHFFDENWHRGIKWYEKHFKPAKAVGEKTPAYFFDRDVPERVKDVLPDVKLIFIFRNPVDRAYSHYWHNVRVGAEKRSFEKAIEDELKNHDTFHIKYRRYSTHSDEWKKPDSHLFRYVGISCYSVFLRRWFRFFCKHQMKFLLLEELSQQKMREVTEFLGINPFTFDMEKHNVGGMPKNRFVVKLIERIGWIPVLTDFLIHRINKKRYPKMSINVRRKLYRYFEPYNNELEKLTGLDLGVWVA